MGMSYAIKNHHNESLIKYQTQKVQKLEKIKELQSELIKSKSSDIEMLRDKTNEYLDNLDQALKEISTLKKKNTSLKDENTQIKKQLKERKEANKHRKLNMEITFYGADCGGCSGITATGIDVSNTIYYKNMRVVASDPRVIPLHSIIKIKTKKESYIAYVGDTGGAIKGNILDVLVSSENESIKHGRQQATVTIIREGKG